MASHRRRRPSRQRPPRLYERTFAPRKPIPSHVPQPPDLHARVDAGASVRAIAAELGVTERTVRNRLHRAGIPLPSEVKAANVDLEAVFAEYRAGTPVATIAE